MAGYGQKFRSQADTSACAAEPKLIVRDFSSYYHCGPGSCRDPKCSVTSHATAEAALRAHFYAFSSCPADNDLPPTSSATYTNHVDDNASAICKSGSDDSKPKFELGSNNSFLVVRNTTSSILCSPSRARCREPHASATNVSKTLKVTFSKDPPGKDFTKLFPKNSKVGFKIEKLPKKISKSSEEKETPQAQLVEKRSSCLKTDRRKPVRTDSADSALEVGLVPEEKKAEKVEFVDNCRRVLYNEGIDDAAASRASLQARSSTPVLLDRIGSWDWCGRDDAPFTYGHKSRYHRSCLEDSFKRYHLSDSHSSSRSRCSLQACRNCSRELVPLALFRGPGARRSRRHLASASDTESNGSLLRYNCLLRPQ